MKVKEGRGDAPGDDGSSRVRGQVEFIARKLINGSVYGEAGAKERHAALSGRDDPRNTSEYAHHGLNSVEQDNGRLYRTVYLHHTFVSEHSDLSHSRSLAARFQDKKEWRGGRAESIPRFLLLELHQDLGYESICGPKV